MNPEFPCHIGNFLFYLIMEQSTNLLAPEAATDEPASSINLDSAEPADRHRPRDWDADLSRPGGAPP